MSFPLTMLCVDQRIPHSFGYCIANNADVGNKVLWKTGPHEQVGVMASKDGRPCIVEYSDITTEMAERTDEDGKLIFGAANICNHYYTLEFLATTVLDNMDNMYHIATKKIPYDMDSELVKPTVPNGMKLESFIFDVFELSTRMAVLEVERRHEFAPREECDRSGFTRDSKSLPLGLGEGVFGERWSQDARQGGRRRSV
jgi:UDP-N-acetylglucosamine/UDP-N-acetylgalactosamine diphosphorylase